ncbi:MAG: sulfite exporter TauE/SafE family protein, partial [Balneolaceae bacterium]
MIEPGWIIAYLILGSAVGFFAGLFGVGGGAIMVPALTTLFLLQDFPPEHIVHAALATSLAAIIVTSFSSLRAHHRHKAVIWTVVFSITPGILVGTFGAAFIAAVISSRALAIIFTCFMAYVSAQMLLNFKPSPARRLPGAA